MGLKHVTSIDADVIHTTSPDIIIIFFNVGSPSGLPLFRPSKIYISHLHTHININNNGRWRHARRRLIRTTSCSSKNCRPQIAFDSSIRFRHHKRKTDSLYKLPSPGFEPTTFLIHDLRIWRLRLLGHRRLEFVYYIVKEFYI